MRSIENNKDKKKKVLKVVGLVGLFVLVFGLSYALFRVTLTGKKKTRISTADFDVDLVEDGDSTEAIAINLENAVPESDSDGIKRDGYKFTVINKGSIPASYTLKLNGTGTLSEEHIKYALIEKDYLKNNDTMNGMHSNETKLDANASYIGAPLLSSLENNKLHGTTLLPGERIEYELKVWIDYDATTEQASGKEYEATVTMDATQAEEYITGKAGDNIDYILYKDGTLVLDGTGATYGIDLSDFKINQNSFAVGDIMYRYLTMNNIDVEYIQGVSADSIENMMLAHFVPILTNGITIIDSETVNSYLVDYFGSEEKASRVEQLIENFDSKISRVVVNEGVTQISSGSLALLGDYMVSLPSTLTTLQPIALQFYDGYTIVLPSGVKEVVDYNDEGSSSFARNEYINFGSVETINSVGTFAKSIYIPNTVREVQNVTFRGAGTTARTITIDNSRENTSNWDLNIGTNATINYLR